MKELFQKLLNCFRYGNRPFYGVERGNQYAPILNEYNGWIQVGNHLSLTCELLNPFSGPPSWGVVEGFCTDDHNQVTFAKDIQFFYQV